MDLRFDAALAEGYRSAAQRARRLTEAWFAGAVPCPGCGAALGATANNTRATDFRCAGCADVFELKSSCRPFGPSVADGAFAAMMARIAAGGGPHLALLRYDAAALRAADLTLIPGPFLTPAIIRPRRPLGPGARRAGWVGCNIRLAEIPGTARVALLRAGVPVPAEVAAASLRRALSLRGEGAEARGWLADVLRCIERLPGREFSLPELYAFEAQLQARHPRNRHVRPKIRQCLQRLRDAGWVTFLGRGRYGFNPA